MLVAGLVLVDVGFAVVGFTDVVGFADSPMVGVAELLANVDLDEVVSGVALENMVRKDARVVGRFADVVAIREMLADGEDAIIRFG